jgi:branched-chain amino acid transport system substrate-binding protein
MAGVASHFGWEVAFGPQIVPISTTNWHGIIDDALACDPAVLANTHFYAGDLAQFQIQLMDHRGAMHHTCQDIAREKGIGAIGIAGTRLLWDGIRKVLPDLPSETYKSQGGNTNRPLL